MLPGLVIFTAKITTDMKKLLFCLVLLAFRANAQNQPAPSPLDALQYGVVLEHPGMKEVILTADVPYLSDARGKLHMDVYLPPGLQKQEKRPAIVFLNGIGDEPGQARVKSWGIYSSWPRLMAANGYVGISMEADGSRIQESLQGIFDFLAKNGSQYHVDADRLGVYAASANVRPSMNYLMGEHAGKGIRAAVLYYGWPPAGPYRKDLSVLAVIAQSDARPGVYDNLWKEVLANHAPWTVKMASGLPHAFDAFTDNDEARKVILETISFWKNHLDPVPAPSWKPSKAREVIAANYGGDRERALALLQPLAAEYLQDVGVQFAYARELAHFGKMEEVERVYQQILKLEPKSLHEILDYAVLLYRRDKPAEAEKYIARAMRLGKMDAYAYGRLGFHLLAAGKDAEAAKYYEEAIALRPTGGDYYNLGCAYSKSGNPDKAFPALQKAVELGYNSRKQFENDTDLSPLKSDSRYQALMEQTK